MLEDLARGVFRLHKEGHFEIVLVGQLRLDKAGVDNLYLHTRLAKIRVHAFRQ